MMLSPAEARVAMVMNCADWPEEAATAATPPSRAATRFSKTSTVGYSGKGEGLVGVGGGGLVGVGGGA